MTKNSITVRLTAEQMERCHDIADNPNMPFDQGHIDLVESIINDIMYSCHSGRAIIVEKTNIIKRVDNIIDVDFINGVRW